MNPNRCVCVCSMVRQLSWTKQATIKQKNDMEPGTGASWSNLGHMGYVGYNQSCCYQFAGANTHCIVMSLLRPLVLLVLLSHCVSSVPLPGVVKSIVEPGVPDVGVTGGEPVGNYERKTQVGRDYTWSRSCAIFGLLMVLIFLCLCRRPLCGVQLHFLWLRLRGMPALS